MSQVSISRPSRRLAPLVQLRSWCSHRRRWPTCRLTRVSSDTVHRPGSQHATEVEPDTSRADRRVVVDVPGRVGSSTAARPTSASPSADGGATWTSGFLPGLPRLRSSAAPPAPVRARQRRERRLRRQAQRWLVSSIPLPNTLVVPTVFVNRSIDDGRTWRPRCRSRRRPSRTGRPRQELDRLRQHATQPVLRPLLHGVRQLRQTATSSYMSTSTDGGLTWSIPIATAGNDKGLGGQPVVQPNGTVVVPFETLTARVRVHLDERRRVVDAGRQRSRRSRSTASRAACARARCRPPRSTAHGNVYVAWEDCRFRTEVRVERHRVQRVSSDGVNWSDRPASRSTP